MPHFLEQLLIDTACLIASLYSTSYSAPGCVNKKGEIWNPLEERHH